MIDSLQGFFGRRPLKENPKVFVIEVPPLMRPSEYADVIAIRHPVNPFRRFTNVPWVMGDNAEEGQGYEWGYSGFGPTDFALNILLQFTDGDEAVARAYCIDFRDEYVRRLPSEGGRIAKEDIFSFVERMKLSNPEILDMVRRDLELMAESD